MPLVNTVDVTAVCEAAGRNPFDFVNNQAAMRVAVRVCNEAGVKTYKPVDVVGSDAGPRVMLHRAAAFVLLAWVGPVRPEMYVVLLDLCGVNGDDPGG